MTVRDPSDGSVSDWPRRPRPDWELDPDTRKRNAKRAREIREQLEREKP